MSRILVTLLTLALLVGVPACGGDDDGGSSSTIPDGPPELQDMALCFADGLGMLGFAIETNVILLYDLERDVPQNRPLGFGYDEDTGEFLYDSIVSDDPLVEWEISGFVTPLDLVEDGLQQGDVITVTWSIREHGGSASIAAGAFRVIDQGLTTPPNQTESLRVIPAGEIWCGPDLTCRTEYTQFELTIHHLLSDDQVRSALAGFQCFNAEGDTLRGYMTGSEATGEASISGTYDGAAYTCDVDLDTYVVDCSGS